MYHRFLNHSYGFISQKHSFPILKQSQIIRSISGYFVRIHSIHHKVSHLDFARGNVSSFVDTAMTGFQIPLGIICRVVFGFDLCATFVAYQMVLYLQATHHVNHTFNLGWFRFVLMDNHAHKLHHCHGGEQVNFGALFSVWDRVFGTYFEDWELSSAFLHKHGLNIATRRR